MGVLEQISQMKGKGVPEEEITTKLQEQKISPKEINDALNQARIKSAVSTTEGMEPSITEDVPEPNQEEYIPRTQEISEEPAQEQYAPQQSQEQYAPQPPQEYYPQEVNGEYAAPMEIDTDTMIEVADQVFSEKMKEIQKQLEKLNEFQTLSQVKIDSTADRLTRIERVIDNLQISILQKVGSYGKNLDKVKKELTMVQDSFKKIPKEHHKTITKKVSKK